MARVRTCLNFPGSTEKAFLFYKSVFGSDFTTPIHRFLELRLQSGEPPVEDADKNLVMHVELPILDGHVLTGTDAPESVRFSLTTGNNMSINIEPDTRTETDRLFKRLSDGGHVEMPLQETFWGGYLGSLTDRFGIRWMVNCASKT